MHIYILSVCVWVHFLLHVLYDFSFTNGCKLQMLL